jgi:hypothetical protein
MASTCIGFVVTLRRMESALSELAIYPGSWRYRRELERRWNRLRWVLKEIEATVEHERLSCDW